MVAALALCGPGGTVAAANAAPHYRRRTGGWRDQRWWTTHRVPAGLGMVLRKNWESTPWGLGDVVVRDQKCKTANPLTINELAVSISIFSQSGRLDLNQRPPAPEAGALPG